MAKACTNVIPYYIPTLAMSFQPLLEKIYSEKTRHSKHYLASMTNNSVYDNNAGYSFYVRY